MTSEIQRYPWEPPLPVPAEPSIEETVKLLQRDFRIAVELTAVLVHSKHPALQIIVNTRRGQIIPRGEVKFTDGSSLEFQDVGMPQANAPYMASVQDLIAQVWDVASKLGLELI